MSNTIEFNDESEDLSNDLDNTANSAINTLLPLDDDRVIEKDENGEEIVDEDKLEIVEKDDPTKKITKHNFVTSPWTKLGIVGGFFALGFGIVFLTLNSLMGGGNEEQIAKPEESAPAPVPFEEQNDGEVYAKLALQKQQSDLKSLNSEEEVIQSDELVPEEKETDLATANKPEAIQASNTTVKKTAQPVKVAQTRQPQPQPTVKKTRTTSSTAARQSPPPAKRRATAPPPPQRKAPTPPPPVKMPKVTIPPENVANKLTEDTDPIKDIERLRNISSLGRIDYGNPVKSSIIASNPSNAIANNNISPLIEPDDVSPEALESRNRRGYQEEPCRSRWKIVVAMVFLKVAIAKFKS